MRFLLVFELLLIWTLLSIALGQGLDPEGLPFLSSPQVQANSTSATISFSTQNIPNNVTINVSAFGINTNVMQSRAATSTNVTLSGLNPGTIYFLRVSACVPSVGCAANETVFSTGVLPVVTAPTVVGAFPSTVLAGTQVHILVALPKPNAIGTNATLLSLFRSSTQLSPTTAQLKFGASLVGILANSTVLTRNGFWVVSGIAAAPVGATTIQVSPSGPYNFLISRATVSVTVPPPLVVRPITAIRISNVTASGAVAEWMPSLSQATGYKVVVAVSTAAGLVSNRTIVNATRHEISGLGPATSCILSITTIGADGTTESTAYSASFVTLKPTPTPVPLPPPSPTPIPRPLPPIVQNVSATNISYFSAIITWTQSPEDANTTGYDIYVAPNGNFLNTWAVRVPKTANAYRVSLMPSTQYAARVDAVNVWGRGPVSEVTSFTTLSVPVISTPVPEAPQPTPTEVAEPAEPVATPIPGVATATPAPTPTPLVRAPTPTPYVLVGPPAQPASPYVFNVSANSINIRWYTVWDNHSPLTQWTLSIVQLDSTTFQPATSATPLLFSAPPTLLSASIGSLIPSTFYGISITATNAVGTSPTSLITKFVTARAPVPPAQVCTSSLNITSSAFVSGGLVQINFSIPVVSSTAVISCSLRFPPATVRLFGSAPICAWTTKSTLSISLSGDSRVTPDDTLVLSPITPICGIAIGQPVNFTISLPEIVDPPVAVIKAPTQISFCSGLTLDGSYSVAKTAKIVRYVWTASDPLLNAIASTAFRPVLSFNISTLSHLPASEPVFFSLTVHDSFGTPSETVLQTVTKEQEAAPSVSIKTTSTLEVMSSNSLYLWAAIAMPPSCGSYIVQQPPILNWTIVPEPLLRPQLATNQLSVFFPRLSLSPGLTYTVSFTATSRTSGLSDTSDVTVTAKAAPLLPIISGGNRNLPLFGAPLVLDARLSVDPDNASLVPSYSWSCCQVDSTGACAVLTCPSPQSDILPSDGVTSNPTLILNPSAGQPFVPGTFRYTMTMTKGARTSPQTSVLITFVPGSVPSVSIPPLAKTKFNPNERLILRAVVSQSVGPLTYSWTAFGSDLVLNNETAPIGTTSSYLVIEKNTMASGLTYVFRVNVTSPRTTTPGMSEISITTASAPFGGSISTNATTVTSGKDWIQISADSWSVDEGDLQYRFVAELPDKRIPLGDFLTSSTVTVRAPFVTQTSNVTLRVLVQSSSGAMAEAQAYVTIQPLASIEQSRSIMTTLLNTTTTLVSSGIADCAQTMRNMVFIASVLNTRSNTNATAVEESGANGNQTLSESNVEIRKQALEVLAAVAPQSGAATTSEISTLSTTMSAVLAVPQEISLSSAQTAVFIMQSAISATADSSSAQMDKTTAENMISSLGNVLASVAINLANDTQLEGPARPAAEIARQVTALVMSVSENLISDSAPGEKVDVVTDQVALRVSRSLPSDVIGSTFSPQVPNAPSIAFPSTPLRLLANMTTPVDVHTTSWTNNPWAGVATSGNLSSSVSTFKLMSNGAELKVFELIEPLLIKIFASGVTQATASCRFFNTTSNQWSTEGGTLHSVVGDYIFCHWTHLTDFGVFAQSPVAAAPAAPTTQSSDSGVEILIPEIPLPPANPTATPAPQIVINQSGSTTWYDQFLHNTAMLAGCGVGLAALITILICCCRRKAKENAVTPTGFTSARQATTPPNRLMEQSPQTIKVQESPHQTHRHHGHHQVRQVGSDPIHFANPGAPPPVTRVVLGQPPSRHILMNQNRVPPPPIPRPIAANHRPVAAASSAGQYRGYY